MALFVVALIATVTYAVVFLTHGPQIFEGSTAGQRWGSALGVLAFMVLVSCWQLVCLLVPVRFVPASAPVGHIGDKESLDV